jgi:hypothetical protein
MMLLLMLLPSLLLRRRRRLLLLLLLPLLLLLSSPSVLLPPQSPPLPLLSSNHINALLAGSSHCSLSHDLCAVSHAFVMWCCHMMSVTALVTGHSLSRLQHRAKASMPGDTPAGNVAVSTRHASVGVMLLSPSVSVAVAMTLLLMLLPLLPLLLLLLPGASLEGTVVELLLLLLPKLVLLLLLVWL